MDNHVDARNSWMADAIRGHALDRTSHVTTAHLNQATAKTLLQLVRALLRSPRDYRLRNANGFTNDLEYSAQLHLDATAWLRNYLWWIYL